jgi:hypothetical protein
MAVLHRELETLSASSMPARRDVGPRAGATFLGPVVPQGGAVTTPP